MNHTKKIAMAIAVFCCAGTSLAQQVNPSWYIQPNVVGVQPDRDFGTDKRKAGGGLKFGKAIAPMWDLQVGASHVRADDGPFNYHQTLFGADALWMLSRKNFRPFVLVGVGAQRDKVSNPLRNNSATAPYAKAGVGFQLGFTEQLAMQADLSTVRGRLDSDDFGFKHSNNKYLTVGLNYAFSKPAPPPAPMPPPQAVEQPAPVPVAPPPPPARFEKVTMSATELFEFNSAKLSMPQPKLDDIAAALAADPSITDVDITGHADRIGSAAYNMKLSTARANAVRDYLVSKGIDGRRLKAYGKGETMPVVTCNNKKRADLIKCLEPNRRVEVEQISIERRVQ